MTRPARPGYRWVQHGVLDYEEECPDMREEPIEPDDASPDRGRKGKPLISLKQARAAILRAAGRRVS